MKFMNTVMSRVEKERLMIVNYDVDEFSKKGSKAKAIGLTRYNGRWYVELEFVKWEGTSETISLKDYMENTKDIT